MNLYSARRLFPISSLHPSDCAMNSSSPERIIPYISIAGRKKRRRTTVEDAFRSLSLSNAVVADTAARTPMSNHGMEDTGTTATDEDEDNLSQENATLVLRARRKPPHTSSTTILAPKPSRVVGPATSHAAAAAEEGFCIRSSWSHFIDSNDSDFEEDEEEDSEDTDDMEEDDEDVNERKQSLANPALRQILHPFHTSSSTMTQASTSLHHHTPSPPSSILQTHSSGKDWDETSVASIASSSTNSSNLDKKEKHTSPPPTPISDNKNRRSMGYHPSQFTNTNSFTFAPKKAMIRNYFSPLHLEEDVAQDCKVPTNPIQHPVGDDNHYTRDGTFETLQETIMTMDSVSESEPPPIPTIPSILLPPMNTSSARKLNPVDSKIEELIRKSRIQALYQGRHPTLHSTSNSSSSSSVSSMHPPPPPSSFKMIQDPMLDDPDPINTSRMMKESDGLFSSLTHMEKEQYTMSMLHRQQSLEKQSDTGNDDEIQHGRIHTTNPWYASTLAKAGGGGDDSSSFQRTTLSFPPGLSPNPVVLKRKNSKPLDLDRKWKSADLHGIPSFPILTATTTTTTTGEKRQYSPPNVPSTATTIRRRGRTEYILDEESDMNNTSGIFMHHHHPRHSRRSRSIPREMKYIPLSQEKDGLDGGGGGGGGGRSRSGSVSSISNNSSFEGKDTGLDVDMMNSL